MIAAVNPQLDAVSLADCRLPPLVLQTDDLPRLQTQLGDLASLLEGRDGLLAAARRGRRAALGQIAFESWTVRYQSLRARRIRVFFRKVLRNFSRPSALTGARTATGAVARTAMEVALGLDAEFS